MNSNIYEVITENDDIVGFIKINKITNKNIATRLLAFGYIVTSAASIPNLNVDSQKFFIDVNHISINHKDPEDPKYKRLKEKTINHIISLRNKKINIILNDTN